MDREQALKQVQSWYKTKLMYEQIGKPDLPEGISEEQLIEGLSNYTGSIMKLIKDYDIKEEEYAINDN